MPRLLEVRVMGLDDLLYLVQLVLGETVLVRQGRRREPELRRMVPGLDVDMRRFAAIAGVEEKAIGPDPQHCGHMPSTPSILHDVERPAVPAHGAQRRRPLI